MDLNAQPPALWTLEDGPYEIADHVVQSKAHVLLLLNAWLDSERNTEEAKDWSTLNFWAMRLRPLWARSEGDGEDGEENTEASETSSDRDTIVIVCNRCGKENGTSVYMQTLVNNLP